jgi:hypothetical protein
MSITPEQLAKNIRAHLAQERSSVNKPELMSKVVLTIEGNVKRVVPVRTGTLRRSITSRVEDGGNRGVVGTNVPYARPVHEGSKPHIIRPRRAKALRFQAGGETVFAKFVRHPGTRGQPFLAEGLRRSRATVDRLLQQAGERLWESIV